MKRLSPFLAVMLAGVVQVSSAQSTRIIVREKPSATALDRITVTAPARLRQDMRKLWSDHVFWTRDYVAAALADRPDRDSASRRLLRNQEDVGNLFAQYYGRDAGDKLAEILKDHILIAVDLINAA